MFPLGSPGGAVSYPLAMFVVGLCLTSPRNVAWILQLGGLASQGPLPFVHYLAMLATGEAEDSQTLERNVNNGQVNDAGEQSATTLDDASNEPTNDGLLSPITQSTVNLCSLLDADDNLLPRRRRKRVRGRKRSKQIAAALALAQAQNATVAPSNTPSAQDTRVPSSKESASPSDTSAPVQPQTSVDAVKPQETTPQKPTTGTKPTAQDFSPNSRLFAQALRMAIGAHAVRQARMSADDQPGCTSSSPAPVPVPSCETSAPTLCPQAPVFLPRVFNQAAVKDQPVLTAVSQLSRRSRARARAEAAAVAPTQIPPDVQAFAALYDWVLCL